MGATRAHVMEWVHARRQWESLCRRPSLAIKPSTWPDEEPWPMKYDVAERLVPWCTQCVASAQREVDRLVDDVLIPAAQEVTE